MHERILIIDDDELVRSGLAANLSIDGFLVSAADSGAAGLAQLFNAPVDLVLCDLALGDMDGIDVLRRIKMEWPKIAVVMITGHASIRNALDALRSGASDYIAKPADPEEVAHRLRTVLDTEHLRALLDQERQRAEERQRENRELMVRGERMTSLGILASGTAEDLADILAPVSEHAARLHDALGSDEKAQERVRVIEEAVRRAAAVLDDLKAIGTGSHYETAPVDLCELFNQYLASDEYQRLKNAFPKVRVDVECANAIPVIDGSADALTRCIGHLMSHSFESVGGVGLIRVSIRPKQIERAADRFSSAISGDYVVLSIADSAPALSEEDLERFFEPFYNRKVMGRRLVSGLGMTLVHRVITDHGGVIDIEPEEGKGNTYEMCLPLAKTEEAPLDLKADYTGRERILVIDDSEEQRRSASDMLLDLGYRVLVAKNGREAIRLVDTALRQPGQHIDLVVIDLVLGDDFDGLETYKGLLALNPNQAAVLVSGFADLSQLSDAKKLGIRQRLLKPYTAQSLGSAIRTTLDR